MADPSTRACLQAVACFSQQAAASACATAQTRRTPGFAFAIGLWPVEYPFCCRFNDLLSNP
eukprot:7041183-Lingulodinium_polyedra.AAC.1